MSNNNTANRARPEYEHLTNGQLYQIRKATRDGVTVKALAAKYGVGLDTITRICTTYTVDPSNTNAS